MPRTTRASLAAAFAAFTSSPSSSSCVSPTPGDRKASAMFRKRQRDWRLEDDAMEPTVDEQVTTTSNHHTAHCVVHGRQDTHAYHHPPSSSSSSSPLQRRRRLSDDDDQASWTRADHDQASWTRADHDQLMDDPHHSDDDEDDDNLSPFKEIQSRVEQVGEQVAQAQRNVEELRVLLLKAITSQRKASASRTPTSAVAANTRKDESASTRCARESVIHPPL